MDARGMRLVAIAGLCVLLGVLLARAGPLDPPPGPVTPTMKTLDEVEPRTPIDALPFAIALPGSYYLTGDLTGVALQNGITITASDVTIDLSGFTLRGIPGSLDGINVSGLRKNITVTNGTVAEWGQIGINMASAEKSKVSLVTVRGNGLAGVSVGDQSSISYITATENLGDGVVALSNCKPDHTNTGKNLGKGLVAGPGCIITFCHANSNGSEGISAGDRSTVESCNATSNSGPGFVVGIGASVLRCVSTSNGQDGIFAAPGTSVTECTTRANGGDGIEVASDCHVSRNTCSANGTGPSPGAGINVLSSDNRIEENNVTDNDWGIRAIAPPGGSLIIRNSASGNTTLDYDIAAGNSVGPITTVTGVPIPAATNAWANFIF